MGSSWRSSRVLRGGKPWSWARGIAVYLARKLTNSSLEQIGQFFGDRDHTTMLHAYRRIEELLESDPNVRRTVGELLAALDMG